MLQIVVEHFLEVQKLGSSVDQSQVVGIEVGLKGGVLEQMIHNNIRCCVCLQFKNKPYSLTVGFISHKGNVLENVFFSELVYALVKLCLVDLVGEFGKYD